MFLMLKWDLCLITGSVVIGNPYWVPFDDHVSEICNYRQNGQMSAKNYKRMLFGNLLSI